MAKSEEVDKLLGLEQYAGYERSIDTHIHKLRKKIEENPSEPRFIQTVFGVGYRFGDVR